MKRQQDRSCIPVRGILRQLDTMNVLGLASTGPQHVHGRLAGGVPGAAPAVLGQDAVAQLRAKLKLAAEKVDQIGSVL